VGRSDNALQVTNRCVQDISDSALVMGSINHFAEAGLQYNTQLRAFVCVAQTGVVWTGGDVDA